jgi:hypothetical protein
MKAIPKTNLLKGNAWTYLLACFKCNHAKIYTTVYNNKNTSHAMQFNAILEI